MYFKGNIFAMILALCCICKFCYSKTSATYCSLDIMKKHAMDACENLYNFETEVRERRSIDHGYHKHRYNQKTSKFLIHISRSNFPDGGYLKVGHKHYNKLSKLNVFPRYKPKKLAHHKHDMNMRYKREDADFHNYSDNIVYCCHNKCEEDFFC
ncbi:insulin-like peptide 8 [Cochliomyia hominivorax]